MARKLVEVLRTMDIFARLSDADLERTARASKERRFGENQVIFRQGEPGDTLFVVLEGRVKILSEDQLGRERVLAFFGPGEFFGEMAVVTGEPRSATVQATTAVKLLQIARPEFDLLASNAEVMKEMLRLVAERQAAANERVSQEAGAAEGRTRGLVTAVYSPRGGSGKSTMAANLGVALAQLEPDRTVLFDLDLMFGHQAILLNLSPRTSLASMTTAALRTLDRESFAYYFTHHVESSLRLLVGASRPEEGEMLSAEHVRSALALLEQQFVHVVVDTSGGFGDATLAALESADQVLVVLTSDLATVRDARECQRVFLDLLGYPPERFKYVLNHLSPHDALRTEQIEDALGQKVALEIPFGGDTPSRAALEGLPLIARWPTNPAARALGDLAVSLDEALREAMALAGR